MKADDEKQENNFDRLRRQADDEARVPDDILELIHELRISQTELEIQNEELQRAHRESLDLHHEYLDLYERAPCAYIALNSNGIITRINHVCQTLLGGVGKKMTSQGFSRYIAPGWEDVYWTALKRSGKTGEKQSLELALTAEDGTHLWGQADIHADRKNSGEVTQWRLTIVDITAKKKAVTALKKSEAFATKITNASLCAIYIYDLKAGRIVFINPQFTRMSGLTLAALADIDEADLLKRFHPEDAAALQAHGEAIAAASDDEVLEVTYRFRKLDGSWIWCLSRDAVFSRDADGKVRELIGTSLDITASKHAEEKLKELNANLEGLVAERTALAEKRADQLQELALELSRAENQEQRRLAGILHDDLQQHLAYIKLRANLATQAHDIRDENSTCWEFKTISDLIQESIDKCRKLSHELTPVELQRDGLPAALESMRDDFQYRYGLKITMDVDPQCESGPSMLSSILFRYIRELLYNTVKHSGTDSAALKISMTEGQIQVNVEDPGKGCDLDEVRSRKGSSSGFGLFNIKDRINFLGGQAEFRSAPGEGFYAALKVPRTVDRFAKDSGPEIPEGTHSPDLTFGRPEHGEKCSETEPTRILIADDHDLLREGLVEMLHGYEDLEVVGDVDNGIDAIRLSVGLNPDVVLMDVSMPEMGGIEASTEIHRILPGIRIIGISMSTDPVTRQRMLNAGACAFLSKSGSFDKLINVIRNAGRSEDCRIPHV